MRIQLPSIKLNIEEIHKNKNVTLLTKGFCFGKYTYFYKNVLHTLTCHGFIIVI